MLPEQKQTPQTPSPPSNVFSIPIDIKDTKLRSSKATPRLSTTNETINSNNSSTCSAITNETATPAISEVSINSRTYPKRWISFQDNLASNYLSRGRRLHGLQFPLHPLQLSGWAALIVFGFSTFFVVIPALHPDLQQPLVGIVSGLYVIHGCAHLAALLLDPADAELRKHSSARIVPEFDRSKHAHVIENGRCHLCNIKTTNYRTKHCSVCNKCVGQFDHHCKWLNHCVGGRNYVAFLMCVVSAVVAAMVILAAVVSELVLYFMHSEWLIMWQTMGSPSPNVSSAVAAVAAAAAAVDTMPSSGFNETFFTNGTTIDVDMGVVNATESLFDATSAHGISLHDTIFLIFISILGILAAITVGLLLHLCFFHVYISFLGLTTYEYIRNQRMNSIATAQAANGEMKSTTEATLNALTKSSSMTQMFFCSSIDPKNLLENHLDEKYQPKTLHCCSKIIQLPRETHNAFYICSMLNEQTTTTEPTSAASNQVFHCCSRFRQIVKLPTNDSDDTLSVNETLQLSEQCTFCSFKMKTSAATAMQASSGERCCAKMHSKHHRWRRKWNCCSTVPDSPDEVATVVTVAPPIHSISSDVDVNASNNHHHRHHHHHHHARNIDIANQPIIAKSMNQSMRLSTNGNSMKPIIPPVKYMGGKRQSLATNLKSNSRPRFIRPIVRLRQILRRIGRRSPSETSSGNSSENEYPDTVAPIASIKVNQIRPMTLTEEMIQQKSFAPTMLTTTSVINPSTNELIAKNGLSMPPQLPPPTRRKISTTSSTEIDDHDETLVFATASPPTGKAQPRYVAIPSMNRRRRKTILRNRSPTLSPIHESGYSNPTTPQPIRHNGSSTGGDSVSNSSSPNSQRSTKPTTTT